jgi:hypothetical protein
VIRAAIARFARFDRAERAACIVFALLVFAPSFAPLAVARAVSPEDLDSGRVQLTPPCPLRAQGKPCWSCGLTRGFAAMARGRVHDARDYNRRAPALFVVCAGLATASLLLITLVVATQPRRRRSAAP